MTAADLLLRPATDADIPAVVALAGAALGWRPDDPNEALFRWKHMDNPFGRSPMWVAVDGDRLAGFRTFLRWEFVAPDGVVRRAVRAVDTATHPAYQGRGIFRRLTTSAVDEMVAEGVDFVFNTPNDQSRPGYLKMGWVEVGRVPVGVRPTSVRALRRMASARVPAGKWSVASRAGRPAGQVLDDPIALAALLASTGEPDGLRTRRTPELLRWRYVSGPVTYRALTLGRDPAEGVALFRLRARGGAVEATIGDLVVPHEDADRRRRQLLAAVRHAAAPDYVIATVPSPRAAVGRALVPVPGLGPILTWRALAHTSAPALAEWDLALGDIELF